MHRATVVPPPHHSAMCIACDAKSLDHAVELITNDIELRGWTTVATRPTEGRPRWVYTIGLEQSFDHPELLVVACTTNDAMDLLYDLVCEVEDGQRLFPGDLVDTLHGHVPVVEAGEAQRTLPLLPLREAYDASIGHRARPWPPLQLLARGLTCRAHPVDTWRVDRLRPLLAAPPGHAGPNRAERRRAERHRGRRR